MNFANDGVVDQNIPNINSTIQFLVSIQKELKYLIINIINEILNRHTSKISIYQLNIYKFAQKDLSINATSLPSKQ